MLDSERLNSISTDGQFLYLAVSGVIEDYDKNVVERYYNAKGSTWCGNKRKTIITKEVFVDKKYKLRVYNNVRVNLLTGELNFMNEGYDGNYNEEHNAIGNPHHAWFSCFGSYKSSVKDVCLTTKDIGQLVLLVYNASMGITIKDGVVMNRMMSKLTDDLYTDHIFTEVSTGNIVSAKDIIDIANKPIIKVINPVIEEYADEDNGVTRTTPVPVMPTPVPTPTRAHRPMAEDDIVEDIIDAF